MIAIIGGTGLEEYVKGKYTQIIGQSAYCITKINGVDVLFISRHGLEHQLMPSNVSYKENNYLMSLHKCKAIISLSACGSLNEKIKPGMLVCPDSVIDWTMRNETHTNRHVSMGEIFNKKLRNIILKYVKGCKSLITIEGPRFSTRAESKMFKSFGADIINMTTCPECFLAKELGMPYCVINMVTDYDSWKEGREVSHDEVKRIMALNVNKIVTLLDKILPEVDKYF
jgi:5'-methylthioadenosine phosphorylase